MALTGPPLTLQTGSHSAIKFRQMLLSMLPAAGVGGVNDCLVKQRVSASQGVLVSAGGLWIKGSSSSIQGDYFDYNDADFDVPATAADGAQTRIDRVIYRLRDPDFVAGTPPGNFEWLPGTAGSGVPPTVPVDSISLAQVARAINGNTLTNANITDERVYAKSVGGSTRGWKQVGPPTTGAYVVGDFGFDGNNALWICSVAGTPGTWRYGGGGPYQAHAYPTGNQTPVGGTLINLNAVDFDPASSFNTTSHLYACPVTGYYQVGFMLDMDTAGLLVASVRQAGSRSVTYLGTAAQTTGVNTPSSGGSVIVKATAGDTLGLYCEFSSGGNVRNVNVIGQNYLTVKLLASQ